MRAKLIRMILISLNAMDGVPMPESTLIAAVQIGSRPAEPTAADIKDAIGEAEGHEWIAGVSDVLLGRTWSLTTAGVHKARAVR